MLQRATAQLYYAVKSRQLALSFPELLAQASIIPRQRVAAPSPSPGSIHEEAPTTLRKAPSIMTRAQFLACHNASLLLLSLRQRNDITVPECAKITYGIPADAKGSRLPEHSAILIPVPTLIGLPHQQFIGKLLRLLADSFNFLSARLV